MSDAVSLKDRIRDWQAENPLRAWRTKQGLSMMDVASTYDLAMSSVQNWETGTYTPSADLMPRLAEIMGIKVATLERNWTRWYGARPDSSTD